MQNINFELEPIFSINVWKTFLDNINTKRLTEECYIIKNNFSTKQKLLSQRGGYQSADIIYNNIKDNNDFYEYRNLIDNIENALYTLSMEMKLPQLLIDNIWVNINSKQAYNISHIHGGSPISGTFYVNIPQDSNADFVLERNLINEVDPYTKWCLNDKEGYPKNRSAATKWSITPCDNLLLLFPGHAQHYVEPNNSDQDRISISFNTLSVTQC